MTVVSSSSTITFAGDGVQNMFDFNFRIFKEDDLSAVVRSGGTDERKLVPGSDFRIVAGIGNEAGGRVQYPVSGDPLPSGDSITLYRTISYSQELELVDNDPFSASLLNEAFDRGVMRDQQLQEQLDRALKYDISTPAEEVLTPQVFMQKVINSRDSAASALSGAVQARDDALLAQTAAQNAQAGAEAAQSAAELARDSASRIAFEDLAALRSATPLLSGPIEAPHGTFVTVEITDYINDSETSYDLNVFGFGEASVSGGIIIWKLESLEADAFHTLEVVRRRRGEVYSETAQYLINVKYVPIQDGPTAVFADTAEGWADAVVDTDGVHAPAYSVGADNAKQIVSAQMEITLADVKLTMLSGSTAAVLNLAEEVQHGDELVTDLGECVVASVSGVAGNYSVTLAAALTGVPTEVFQNPAWEGISVLDGTTDTTLKTKVKITEGEQLKVAGKECTAGAVTDNSNTATVNSVQPFGDSACTATYQFEGSGRSLGPSGGEITTGLSYVEGKSKQGGICTLTNTNLNISMNWSNFTVSWFYNSSKADSKHSLMRVNNASSYCGIFAEVGYTRFHLLGSVIQFADELINDGKDHHICATGSGSLGLRLYIDGVYQSMIASYGAYGTTGTITQLGYGDSGRSMYYDQIRFFNRSVTQEEVLKLRDEVNVEYSVDISAAELTAPPTLAAKQSDIELKLGAGMAGEYVGPEIQLKLKGNNILPVMTGETTDGVTITADQAGYEPYNLVAWKVSDGMRDVITSPDGSFYDSETNPTATITFDFNGVSQSGVYKYTLYPFVVGSSNYNAYQFKDWTLEAYNEDGQWVAVDTHADYDWSENVPKEFAATFPPFTKLRLAISNSTNGVAVGLVEIEFHKAGSSTEIELVSNESIKDKIFVEGGVHNKLKVDGEEVEVTGVSEIETASRPVNIIPEMTGETTGGCTITATNSTSTTYLPWKAGKTSNAYADAWYSDGVPATLSIDFVTAKNVAMFALTAPPVTAEATSCPSSFVLRGSNDKVTWTELKNVTGEASWGISERREYACDDIGSFRYYELQCSASEQGTYIGIQQLEMISPTIVYYTTVTLATPLAQAPTTASIPDRCTLSPAALTEQIDSGELKITADMIELADDHSLKRLAMAVIGADLRFKSGKIYIKEKP